MGGGGCSTVQDPILKQARRLVGSEFRSWKDRGVANPRLNMPQDSKTWARLRDDLIEVLKAAEVLE